MKQKFITFYDEDIQGICVSINDNPSMALPDLTFTIQELSKRFQVNQLLLYNANAKAMFDIANEGVITDSDFERPSVNLPKNFDLVDSYKASKKFYDVRQKFRDSMIDLNKRISDERRKQKESSGSSVSTKTE